MELFAQFYAQRVTGDDADPEYMTGYKGAAAQQILRTLIQTPSLGTLQACQREYDTTISPIFARAVSGVMEDFQDFERTQIVTDRETLELGAEKIYSAYGLIPPESGR